MLNETFSVIFKYRAKNEKFSFNQLFQYAKNMAELDQIVADVSQYFDLEQSKSKPRKTLAFKHIDSILLSLGSRKVRTVNICLVPCNLNFA